MPTQRMPVYWNKEKVGELHEDELSPLAFTYDSGWIERKAPALSLSMPLRSESYLREALHFFGNLLPEGDYRRRVEKLFKVSQDNDYSLLREIGGDCAGALTIGEEAADSDEGFYELLSNERLAEIVRSEGLRGLQTGGQNNRLSLAGAQGKLPIRYQDGKFSLPQKGAPSTHIMKFNRQSNEYPHLVENEYFLNRCAFHVGLPVISCFLHKTPDGTAFVAKRYDRSEGEWPERIHQEDFCQALGYPYSKKYEKEGGPSFAQCTALVREQLSLPALNALVDWFLFNLLMGNSDAHGKNLSLIHSSGAYQLAPFYDLVCTRAYERLDQRLAMGCGGEFDLDQITWRHLKVFCKQIQITPSFLNRRLQDIKIRIPKAMQKAKDDILQQGFVNRDIQNVEQTLGKIHRHVTRQISSSAEG